MDAQLKRLFIGMVVLVLSMGSCNIGAPPAPTSVNNDALTVTSLVQTVTAQAVTVTAPVDVASATLPTGDLPTVTVLPPTVSPTAAPVILTPTFTLVPSPTVPMVSVTTGTNCRTGPGQVYDLIGGAPEGVKFVLIGRNTQTDYWIIRLQDGRECWLWGRYAVPEGNVGSLPEYAIPPTPLPPVGSVSGTIAHARPIPNATVTLYFANRTYTTSNDGKYYFNDVPVGEEFITVQAPSYSSAFRVVTISKGSPLVEDIGLSTGTPYIPPASVEGRVLLGSAPVAGASVWIWGRNTVLTTDANGRYRFDTSASRYLILSQIGSYRGGVAVDLVPQQTTIAPDIILLER